MSANFELYKVFYFAAKHLSYTKAADELFVTQSAISQTIHQLEKHLECQLFYKSGRTVQLTHEGQMLFQYVEKAYKNLTKAEVEIRNMGKLEQGTVTVGASDTISRYFLLKHIKHFHEKYPSLHLSINNRPSPVSLDLVRKGEIDFAVVNHTYTQEDKNLTFIKVSETANVFIAASDYAEKHMLLHKKLNLPSLIKHPLITLEKKSTTRRMFDRFLADHHLIWSPAFEGGSVDFILEMVAIGMGIGFVPDMALGHWQNEQLEVLSIKQPLPKTDICIVVNSSIPISRAAERLIEDIKSSLNA